MTQTLQALDALCLTQTLRARHLKSAKPALQLKASLAWINHLLNMSSHAVLSTVCAANMSVDHLTSLTVKHSCMLQTTSVVSNLSLLSVLSQRVSNSGPFLSLHQSQAPRAAQACSQGFSVRMLLNASSKFTASSRQALRTFDGTQCQACDQNCSGLKLFFVN